jgi:hypothetical protein
MLNHLFPVVDVNDFFLTTINIHIFIYATICIGGQEHTQKS